LLLSRGADVNDQVTRESSVLHKSVQENYQYFVERLLSAGADVSLADSNGHLALDIAIQKGHHEIAVLLLGHGSPTRSLGSICPSLLLAIESCDVRLAGILLGSGADPDNAGGQSPLTAAIEIKNERSIRLLLAVGANTNFIEMKNIPMNLRRLFEGWSTAPIESSDKDNVNDLRSELRKAKMNAAKFLDRNQDTSRFSGPLTPLLGEVNKMVVLLGRLATIVEHRTRQLRERRQIEIAGQLTWLSDRERHSVTHQSVISNESEWRSNLSRALGRLSEFEDSTFPVSICDGIRSYLSSLESLSTEPEMPDGSMGTGSEPSSKSKSKSNSKSNSNSGSISGIISEGIGPDELGRRGRLLYLNSALPKHRKYLIRIYEFSQNLCSRIDEVLDNIESALTEIIDLVVIQQQMNFDFEKVHSQASIPGQAAGALQDRKELLTLDRARVSWERAKFKDMSEKVFRLLRYCVV
jgi:hypothetical protein